MSINLFGLELSFTPLEFILFISLFYFISHFISVLINIVKCTRRYITVNGGDIMDMYLPPPMRYSIQKSWILYILEWIFSPICTISALICHIIYLIKEKKHDHIE